MSVQRVGSSPLSARTLGAWDQAPYTKHGLIYFELKMACLLTQCFGEQLGLSLERSISFYKEKGPFFKQKSTFTKAEFDTEDQSLEKQLEELYITRARLEERFRKVLQEIRLDEANKLWEEIDSQFDSIYQRLSRGNDLPQEERKQWEGLVEKFLQSFGNVLAEKSLGVVAGKFQILTFYTHWEQILQDQEQELRTMPLHLKSERLRVALKIKRLIYVDKTTFFTQFFRQKQDRTVQFCKSSIKEVLENISSEIEASKGRINAQEGRLLNSIDLLSHWTSSVLRVILDSSYVQRASLLIEEQERIALSRKWGSLSVPLSDGYLALSKGLAATGLLGLDLMEWKVTGLSQNVPHALSQYLAPSSDFLLKIFHKLGAGDEKTVATYLPSTRTCVQLGLFVGLSGYFGSRSVAETSMAYGVAFAASEVASKCVQLFYKAMYGQEECPTYPLVRDMARWVSFPLAGVYLTPYLFDKCSSLFLSAPDTRKEACALLGVSESASPQEVRRAYRKLARSTHPDLTSSSTRPEFDRFTQAKKLCSNLFERV